MREFTRMNKNKKSYMVVTKYNWPVEAYLKGHAIVLQVYRLEDILRLNRDIDNITKIAAYVYRDDYASLETLDIDPNWDNLPIMLIINRMGQYRDVAHKIELLKKLNVIVYFTSSEAQACRDAQILSSLGIHSGIMLKPDSELSDHVLDLITYWAYSPMPHAAIEPFSTMEHYYDGEQYVSPDMAYFVNPERYLYVDKNLDVAFSQEQIEKGQKFESKFTELTDQELTSQTKRALTDWQKFFIEPHHCTFCPAFRVCQGYFYKEGEENKQCSAVMNELLDAIEFKKKKDQSNNKNQECQL